MNSTDQSPDHPPSEVSYRAELKSGLLRELKRGPTDFQGLVTSAEGAYPIDVMMVMKALVAENEVSESDGLWFSLDKPYTPRAKLGTETYSTCESLNGLPEPHPLDFDWRFTQRTLRVLEELVNAKESGRGAILGAPSLYKYLFDLGASVSLYDKNHGIVEHLRSSGYFSVTEVDLTEPSDFTPHFHWAMADPPWYSEHYEGFLNAASRLLLPAGKLFLSVLPRLTRPSAAADRFHTLEVAQNLGFDLIEIKPATLEYASPPFEIEALREQELALGDWRNGDLFSFILSSRSRIESKTLPQTDEVCWQTIVLGATTVKIRDLPFKGSDRFGYRSASSAGRPRLGSVSRRSPIRSEINVWTSRNVALVVSKPEILTNALNSIVDGKSLSESLNRMTTAFGLDVVEFGQLREILELLMQDAGIPWN